VSEQGDGCLWPLVGLLLGFVVAFVAFGFITNRKQDNYIRDLQRRVGQLESERR
jgi:hypothetical protein